MNMTLPVPFLTVSDQYIPNCYRKGVSYTITAQWFNHLCLKLISGSSFLIDALTLPEMACLPASTGAHVPSAKGGLLIAFSEII